MDGRLFLVAIFLLGSCTLAAISKHFSYQTTRAILHGVGVAAASDPFLDLHGVVAWLELEKQGIDSTRNVTSIRLPSGKIESSFLRNYPPVVLHLGKVGVSTQTVLPFGWLLAGLYLIAVCLLADKLSAREALWWALFFFAPPSLLVMERANFDSLVFALLVISILLYRTPLLAILPILVAAIFKFFPISALGGIFARFERKSWIAGSLALAIFAAYLFIIRHELGTILSGLTTQHATCFGATVIANLLAHYDLISPETFQKTGTFLKVMALIAAGVGFLLGGYFVQKYRQSAAGFSSMTGRSEFAALMGISIFGAMFFTGPQMDYKWIFLLLALPGMLEWRQAPQFQRRIAGIWILFALLYAYWTVFSGETSLRNALLRQGVGWGLYFVNCLVFGALVWMRIRRGIIGNGESRSEIQGTRLIP